MRAIRLPAFALIALALLTFPAFADGNFLKVGGIKGAATESNHYGWVEIGGWQTIIDRGFHILGGAKSQFLFDTNDSVAAMALAKAAQDKTFFDSVLFDVSIKGSTLRTTLHGVRVISVATAGKTRKVTLQFKSQTDQAVRFAALK